MKITKFTGISLRVLMHLALVPEQRFATTEIAQRYNLSRNHLVKDVQ